MSGCGDEENLKISQLFVAIEAQISKLLVLH